jgi:hypothetical protein
MGFARMTFTFLAGGFGAAFLLARSGTGQAQLLRGSELVTAKSSLEMTAPVAHPLTPEHQTTLTARFPLQKARAPKFSSHRNAHTRIDVAKGSRIA